MLVFHPGLIRRCAEKTLALVNRIRPFKHPERIGEQLDNMVNQYTGTADYYRTHKGVIFAIFLITLVQRAPLFLVTWFTYCAFDLSGESLSVILLLQAMISVAVDMLPLPGGMGISENLFLEIFLPVFGAELILSGIAIHTTDVVHYGYIEKFIERLGERFNIREIAFDRWGAVQMVQNLEGIPYRF